MSYMKKLMHGSNEVISIKNSNNGFLYKRPMVIKMMHLSDEIELVNYTRDYPMFGVNSNITIDWGDNSSTDTMINYNGSTSEGGIYHEFIDTPLSHDITFIGDITTIVDTCFCTNSFLLSASLPYGLTTIKSNAFFDCNNLSLVSIPYGVVTLGNYAFYSCDDLSSIEIPNSITSIGTGCFKNCNNLNTYQLYWTGNNIITYNSETMPNNTNTNFYVPKGQKTNYVNKGYPSDKVIERTS